MKVTSTPESVTESPVTPMSDESTAVDKSTVVDGPYAKYVLAVLVVMGVFNFIDRQIFVILAEDIKADLQLSDGDLGFLFGTAFAVFYAVFGIPLGRLADSWTRTKQISLCVGFWSMMTALSGLARSFLPLAICRFGVAMGEAGASPAALSLLYDYFSPKVRTTVMGIYAAGLSIGAGIGLFLGGAILEAWSNAWPDPSLAPFGLKGWQAAFMVVGLPGLILSLLIWMLKEPMRGQAEPELRAMEEPPTAKSTANRASAASSTAHPLRTLVSEILPMLPGINLWLLRQEGAGTKAQVLNLAVALGITLAAYGLIQATGATLQWLAFGIGLYCAFSWAQLLVCRDRVCFGLIFRCKTVRYLYLFFGLNAFTGSAIGFWMIPWFQRYFGVSAVEVGTVLGFSFAVFGLIGMILGGVIADRLRRSSQRGKLYVALCAALLWLFSNILLLSAENLFVAYALAAWSMFLGNMINAPVSSSINDLMLPRIRAVAMAIFVLISSLLGIALGPYCVGLISDAMMAAGSETSVALRFAMQLSLVMTGSGIVFLILAVKYVIADENSLMDRARVLGESA